MAFIRWRGNCAQLLASITVDGRPRQKLLANLHGAYHTTPSIWKAVADNFPDIIVDWAAVDQALAIGPPTAEPPSPQHQQWAETAHHLLVWATHDPDNDPHDRQALRAAAEVLNRWQTYR